MRGRRGRGEIASELASLRRGTGRCLAATAWRLDAIDRSLDDIAQSFGTVLWRFLGRWPNRLDRLRIRGAGVVHWMREQFALVASVPARKRAVARFRTGVRGLRAGVASGRHILDMLGEVGIRVLV
jgi:hypothetical protein